MDPLSGGLPPLEPRSTDVVGKVDYGIYRVERALAWGALLVMAVAYFLSIVDRELTAGEGENAIERFILKRTDIDISAANGFDPKTGEIDRTRAVGHSLQGFKQTDPEFLDRLHNVYAPAAGIVLLLLLMLAAGMTLRRRAVPGGPEPPPITLLQRALFVALGIAVLGAFLYMVLNLPSRWVCLFMLGAGFAGGVWKAHTAGKLLPALAVGTPVVLVSGWLVWTLLGEGYTWKKELAMVLMMWVGFLGASMATFENRNIQVDFVRKNVPKRFLRQYEVAGSIVTALFTVLLAALAYDAFSDKWEEYVPAEARGELKLIRLPKFLVVLPIALGFAMICFRYISRAVRLAIGAEEVAGLEFAPADGRKIRVIGAVFGAIALLAVLFMGNGAWLMLTLLVLLLAGAPLYVLIGGLALSCFAIWPDTASWWESLNTFSQNFRLMPKMEELATQESLIAIPFFMVAGAIMSRGAIARQLVECARATFGWLPGGLGISAVMACMFFAAISGSSPVTVITIGAIMYPAMKEAGYPDQFSLGLVTSAGSLGIIIPPSIPMIVFAIFASMNKWQVDIKDLFIAGIGPGLVIGMSLGALCVYQGRSIPRDTFSFGRLFRSVRDGFWALFLPGFILAGIYLGVFNAIEASAIAVILALMIELFVHRELDLSDLPAVLADSAALMGSILVIICVALGLSEFLTNAKVPEIIVEWLTGFELSSIGFVLVLNVMLLIVGCMMDIISALILFVPLIVPLAKQLGFDPIHLGLIFIVNLEIGYLTPPLGLNLFVSSGFFQKPFGEVMRSVLPFIGALALSLALITAVPTLSVGLVNLMHRGETGHPRANAPLWVSFPDKVLKPSKKQGETSFVDQLSRKPGADGEPVEAGDSMQYATDSSRGSIITGGFVDFQPFGVRGVAIEKDGKHVRTVVVITTEDENCLEERNDDEWLLRIELPAGAKAGQVFDVTKHDIQVSLDTWEGGKKTKELKPTKGLVLVQTPEQGKEITVWDPENKDSEVTFGLFGAIELTFQVDGKDKVMKGKFVPLPCDEGTIVYR